MTIDYQLVVKLMIDVLYVTFPIAFIFMICQKLVFIFVSFVFGKEVNF